MRLAALAALFALTCLTLAAVGTRAYSDTPKSPVPNGNESDGNAIPRPRHKPDALTPQHPIPLEVRVVLKSDPKKRVRANVLCIPLEMIQPGFVFLKAVSNENGDLHATRTACPMLVRAETADNRLGGIVQITADDEKVVIPVDPTATLRGRLIQQSTGQPVVNQWINCGVKAIYPPQRMSIWGFSNSARTDAQGKFTLIGLIPNWKFDLSTWTKPASGRGTTWTLGAVSPRHPGILDLGDIKLGAPDEAPRPGKPRPQRERIYNPKADAKADLDQALKTAGEENKRVLVAFGGNWCQWCFKLDDVLTKNVELAPIVKKGFVLVLVDANSNRKLLESYTTKDECRGFPFLTVLDAKGNVVKNQNTDELEDGSKHDVTKVGAFLTKWSPAH